jgi:hypothetical protein
MRKLWLLGAALAMGACNQYTYVPSTNATAAIRGQTAAKYDIPSPAEPQGDVRIASFGISKVTRQDGTPMRAIHVRLVASNNSAQPWTIDTRQQLADIRNVGQVSAAFARSEGQDLPLVAVAPGQKRTVDIFFPLPAQTEKASKIPEFDVLWKVQAGSTVVAQRTPFERLQVAPMMAAAGFGYPYYGTYGFGPYGWYDPFWGPGVIASPAWYW